jgi:hypothetical protein
MTEPQRYSDYHCSIIDRIYSVSGRGWFGRWRLKLAVLGAICLIILAGRPSEYSYAEMTVDEVLGVTPFSSEDRDMVKNGITVSTELIKVADRELAIGVACLIKEDGRDLLQTFREESPLLTPEFLKTFGQIGTGATLGALQEVSLGDRAAEEAQHYLQAKPGFGLNLSVAEIDMFKSVKVKKPGEANIAQVHKIIQNQLFHRFVAYRDKGLDGIDDYARKGGKSTQLARDLKASLNASQGLKELAPYFYRAWLEYPGSMPANAKEIFFWCRLDIKDRPALSLAHRIATKFDTTEIIGERYFYISRFFDVAYALVALVPTKEGTLFFYVNRFWVDYWSGLVSLKRAVGKQIMAGRMKTRLENLGICR